MYNFKSNFNGREIDMLSLGDADSILVTGWYGTSAWRALIDGGRASDAKAVRVSTKRTPGGSAAEQTRDIFRLFSDNSVRDSVTRSYCGEAQLRSCKGLAFCHLAKHF